MTIRTIFCKLGWHTWRRLPGIKGRNNSYEFVCLTCPKRVTRERTPF